ncbi:MAG: 16S rRNA (cytosine(967)-C(5))-methyltransferase RsmB [Planctomycetes bacterium]|nr:16S rRNA (cytosine(967)-C(5))-methyltransferase RsmB [Planctomycetota bacterium]
MTTPVPTLHSENPSARALALQILLDLHKRNAFIQEVLDSHLGRVQLAGPDRRLVTQLAYGVLRRRGTLDTLLQPLVARPRHQVEPWLWEALRLGAYQLAVLTHLPPHAVLNETVELAMLFQRPGAKGFLNGVLRALSRLITEERSEGPAADALPLEDGSYRRLARPAFPHPAAYFTRYFASAFALPAWLAERWSARYPREECVRLGFWFAGPAPLWLRSNPLKASREQCLQALAGAGIAAEPGEHPQSIRLHETRPVRELPGFAEGWLTVQDESAMGVASALAPEPGSRVLDLCAAPGGKTTHLAELMHNEGRIVACDIDERRLRTVSELAARLGIGIIETHLLDPAGKTPPPQGPFDAVLLDVPCSNTGVLGRRPEVRWRLRPEELPYLVRLQHWLLHQACERVRPGGVIVYSTCSIEPEEDRLLVRALLKEVPGLVLEAEEERTPGRPADGGYWARLRLKRFEEKL